MMNIAAWFAFVLGIITGGSIMYIRQRKLRMEELGKAAAMTEDILAGIAGTDRKSAGPYTGDAGWQKKRGGKEQR